jgi:protein-S-isoprenylcysteine O-methyltransferase Ste14
MHIFAAPPQWFPSPASGQAFSLCTWGWLLIEIINRWLGRRHQIGKRRRGQDRGSYWAIVVAIYASIAVAYLLRSLKWGIAVGVPQDLGMALMLIGILLREWAIVVLGRYFSVVVKTEPGQHLVAHGPYRWLRHPAYTGTLITILGFPLALGTWSGPLAAETIALVAITYRVRVEERALIATLGDEYREYIRHTWRFFPGW